MVKDDRDILDILRDELTFIEKGGYGRANVSLRKTLIARTITVSNATTVSSCEATLPSFVEGSKIFAEFKDGLLTVTLPKNATAIPKQIEVKVSSQLVYCWAIKDLVRAADE